MDEDKLIALRKQLDAVHKWPSLYVFKFVLPSDEHRILQLKAIFDENAEVSTKLSGKGNYTSITVKEVLLCADDVFARYEKASKIEGIISL